MTPKEMTELTKGVSQLVEDRGATQTILIIVLVAIIVIALVGLNEYKTDKQATRKEAEEKRKLDIERNENYIKMIERITDTMSKNSYSLDDFGRKIEEHQNYSTKNLNSINNDLIEIKKDLSTVSGMSDKMATKEGLKEVKDKVEDLIKALE